MKIEDIIKEFPAELIKTRPSPGGELRYVEGAEYIKRLNEVFDHNWSFEIIHSEIAYNEVIVHGRIRAKGNTIEKEAFGGAKIKTYNQNGDPISIGDDYKAASTDALKKACSLFGIGLHLYHPDPVPEDPQKQNNNVVPINNTRPQQRPPQNQPPPSGRPTGGASEKQINYIKVLGKNLGLSVDSLQQMCLEYSGKRLEAISKDDASAIISRLQSAPKDVQITHTPRKEPDKGSNYHPGVPPINDDDIPF